MTSLIRAAFLLAALALPALSQADFISGDISAGGSFNGMLTRDDAWIEANPNDGTEVNFWTFTAAAGNTISIEVTQSAIELGFSIYYGLVEFNELFIVSAFEPFGDFGDNLFIASTPIWSPVGASLLDVVLPYSGIYTLAVGGEEGGHGFGSFAYTFQVTPVPLPAAAWLLGSGLLALGGALRRRNLATA